MNSKNLVKSALIAAVYIALTYVFQSTSFGPIQFRVSEVLNLLAFYNSAYIPGITLGCAIANLSSPFGIVDIFVGGFHTLISLIFMSRSKNIYIASLWPAIFSFIIGLEIVILSNSPMSFAPITLSIMLSEFIICSVISIPVYKILEKNNYIKDNILSRNNSVKTFIK